jgi:hypothetical protein
VLRQDMGGGGPSARAPDRAAFRATALKKDRKSFFPYCAVDPSQSGAPALTAELLGWFCPNWWHGPFADLIRSLLSRHGGQDVDPLVLHELLMVACQSQIGRCTNFDWLQQLLPQLGLEPMEADFVLQSVQQVGPSLVPPPKAAYLLRRTH